MTLPHPTLHQMSGELHVGEEFLAKYNRPGPRYTSYPTAPVWNDTFGPADLERVHEEAERARTPVSLYMHIPFCESLCLFCACNVVIQKNKSVAPPYLDVLKQEMKRIGRSVSRNRPVVQFHWGGGTPTYLTPEQIEDLFTFTREHFHFDPNSEIGIEVDPRVTSRQHLETLRKLGFNRLSMGIQDFQAEVQQAVHRIQPYEMTRDLLFAARELGFDSINVDLIYGLPYQTADTFAHTVDQIIGIAPDRIALFSYAHVPWLKKQQGSFAAHLPEGMEKFEIFRTGLLKFLDTGYLYIGMDHFAKPGDELAVSQQNRTLHRNFQGYTTKAGADLYGMGITAISGIQGAYAQNYRDIPSWEKAIAERGLATMRGYQLSNEDRLRRALISRLLCHTVVIKDEISREFGIDFDAHFAEELRRLEPSRQDGLVLGLSNELLQAPPRAPRYVLVDGELRPVPLRPPAFFMSSLINASTKWALLRDIFGKTIPPDTDESVASFIRRKFSPQLLDRLVGPFVSGIYAGDPERLSVRSSFPQLYEAEKVGGSIARGMLRVAKPNKGPRERPILQSFREGNETLVRALANKLGPALLTSTCVAGVFSQTDCSFKIHLENRDGSESVFTNSLILATPTDVTGRLLSHLDSSFESLLGSIDYAAVAVVSLGYFTKDIAHSLNGFGFLVALSAGLRVLGSVWNSSLFPGRAPEGHALLTSFVGGTTDPAAAKLNPEELASLVHREISPLLSIRSEPVFSNVTIWPGALPQYNLGHSDRLAAVAKLCSRFPGLWLTGNYLRGPAIGSCVDQALAVGDEVRNHLTA